MKNAILGIDRRSARLCALLIVGLLISPSLYAQVGNDNPTGPAGIFNGNILTGCSYDAYTGNATRSITDMTVAGAVGAYGLSITRTINSRNPYAYGTANQFGTAGGWHHSYDYSIDGSEESTIQNFQPTVYPVYFPDGRSENFSYSSADPGYFRGTTGVRERFLPLNLNTMLAYLIFSDGGRVEFKATAASYYDGELRQWHYSYSYLIQAIIDPTGLKTTITHNGGGNLNVIQEPGGRWIQFSYIATPWINSNGQRDVVIDHITASDGRQVQYHYGQASFPPGTATYTYLGNAVYYPDPSVPSPPTSYYTYQAPNAGNINGIPLLSSCDDPLFPGPMKKLSYTYATANADGTAPVVGQIRSENSGTNGQPVSTLDILSQTRRETRGDGPSRTFTYNGYPAYLLRSYTDFMGRGVGSFGYDFNNYTSTFLDGNSATTSFTREAITGRITVLTHPPDVNNVTSRIQYFYTDPANPYYLDHVTDELNHTTYYRRDANHRIYEIDYPDGGYETFTYNALGQVLQHRMTNGGIESSEYDASGQKSAYRDPYHQTGNPSFYYQYDAQHRLSKITDARGTISGDAAYTTRYSYNPRGELTRVTHPDGSFAQTAYNADGTVQSATDELNHTTSYAYDDYKRPITRTDARGKTTSYNYVRWNTNNSYMHTLSVVFRMTTPLGKLVDHDVDDNFRVRDERAEPLRPDDAQTNYIYDPVGNRTGVQDARGNWTYYGYDKRNRLIWINDPLYRNSDGFSTSFSYDQAGNKLGERRANNQLITFDSYDAMNRLTRQTERRDGNAANNMVTNWTWYQSGLLHTMTDPRGKVYTYGYDSMNRKASMAYPLDAAGIARQETWDYDTVGNLWHFHNRRGNTQTFSYDNRSRQTYFSWDDGTMARTTGYDAASRITHVGVYDGNVDFTYNETNQVLTDAQYNYWTNTSRTVTNTYDNDGNRLTLSYPAGYNYTYAYTGRNQLDTIQDTGNPGGGNLVDYTYDKVGNRVSRVNRYNTRTDYGAANALNRIPWLQHSFTPGAGGATARFDYGFDAVSRLTYEQRDSGLADGYGYDLSDQVTVNNRNGTLSGGLVYNATSANNYAYDADGNRTSVVTNGATTSYTAASDVNQYTNINGVGLGYEGNGSLSAYNGWTYGYDGQNRLVFADNNGSNTHLRLYYDGLNRQIMRDVTVGGVLTRTQFTYDGWKDISEYDGSNNLQACYLHGAATDELLSRFGGTSALVWYHQDGRGNVARISDQNGYWSERYTYDLGGAPTIYDPFGGNRTVSWCNNRFLFQTRDYIKEGSIYDYRNRFYSPALNRFLQPDPIGFAGDSKNIYRYCGGDPVNRRDPFGLDDLAQRVVVTGDPVPSGQSPTAGFGPSVSFGGGGHSGGEGGVFEGFVNPKTKGFVDTLPQDNNVNNEIIRAPSLGVSFYPPGTFSLGALPGALAVSGGSNSWDPLWRLLDTPATSAEKDWTMRPYRFVANHASIDVNINTPFIGGNLGHNVSGTYGSLGAGPGAGPGEATLTVNFNIGEVPRGAFVGIDGAFGDGIAGRFSTGFSDNGGWYFSFGAGLGYAAYFGSNGGGGGYINGGPPGG